MNYEIVSRNNFLLIQQKNNFSVNKIDCIIFDVDGVLIDVRKSYNNAIIKTVKKTILEITGSNKFHNVITNDILLNFRQSGGFNNDTDTSYAIILSLLSIKDEYFNNNININDVRNFLYCIARNSDNTGIKSVEKYLRSLISEKKIQLNKKHIELKDIDKIKDVLNYPNIVGKSIVATIFDEIFYGEKLFKKKYGFNPKYYFGKPLIDNDKITIKEKTIKHLSIKFCSKLGIISGRSKIAAKYSLGKYMKYFFSDKVCIFLEDEKREYAKPNPFGIIKSVKYLKNINSILYVGDSIEDLIMVEKAREKIGIKISFCGIYGYSINPSKMLEKFKEKKADIIIKDINLLPKILNKVSTI